MNKTIVCLLSVCIAFAIGFFCGQYKYVAKGITYHAIPQVKVDIEKGLNALPKNDPKVMELKEILAEFPLRPEDMVINYFTRRVDFGKLVLMANDDFTQYAFGKKNESGQVQWITSEMIDDDNIYNEYYGPKPGVCWKDLLPVDALYTLFRDRETGDIKGTYCWFDKVSGPASHYVDTNNDGLWDRWVQVTEGKSEAYERDGLQWVKVQYEAEEEALPEE